MKYKIITIIFYLSLVCLILPQAVHAAIYYVDIDGVGEDGILGTGDDVVSDDANPGTSEQPWKTLNRAYTWYSGSGVKVQEGDTVLFRNGDYGAFTESTRYNPGETWLFYRNDWITYKADTGHSPILTKVEIHNEDKWGEIEHGRSYLKFDGFNVLQGVGAAYTSYVQILDCNVTGGGLIPYEGMYAPYYTPNTSAVSLGGNGMRIENCKVSYGWRGITIGGPNAVVKSNAVHRFAEDGIEAGSTGVGPTLIDDNHIYDANPRRSTYDISGTLDGSFTNGQAITQAGTNAEGIVYNYAGKYGTIAVLSTSVAGFLKQSYGGGTITGPTGTLSNISLVDGAH